MEKEFIPYEQALSLKELGFDEPCFGTYGYNGENKSTYFPLEYICKMEEFQLTNYDIRNSNIGDDVSAPTFSQAFRWFREKHGLHSTITSISQESWQWHITKPGESLGKLYDEDFYTYEEAELTCLRKLIEIVKQNL